MPHLSVLRDGAKNYVISLSGLDGPAEGWTDFPVAILSDIRGCKQVKVDRVVYATEPGTKVRLKWSRSGPFLPVEARGVLTYYDFDSLQPPEPDDLIIQVSGSGLYHIVVDMTKQG